MTPLAFTRETQKLSDKTELSLTTSCGSFDLLLWPIDTLGLAELKGKEDRGRTNGAVGRLEKEEIEKMGSEPNGSSSGNNRGKRFWVDCSRYRSPCGYCSSTDKSSILRGFSANFITVDDYQDHLDRNWRRSGCFIYKPVMKRTCCPGYTIRLRASDFVLSKEQLRVLKRMQRFLDGTLDAKKPIDRMEDADTSKGTQNCGYHEVSSPTSTKSLSVKDEQKEKEQSIINSLTEQIDNVVGKCIASGEFPFGTQLPRASVKKVIEAKRKLLAEGSEDLSYSSNIAFQIAAALRRAQMAEKDVQSLKNLKHISEENGLSPKTIAEKLASLMNQLGEMVGLHMRACNGHINFYSAARDASLDKDVPVVSASEESVTGSKSKKRKISDCPQLKRQKLTIRLKRSSFDPEEFSLYRRYEIKVHDEPPDSVTEDSYREFLVDTPLVFVPPSGDGKVPPCGFGSFHQQYLIDDQLVAVGVIDILPRCLSSKYFFWDPDYAFLSLGKFSALKEIEWVKENQAHCPSLQFYYLGSYIPSCSKMRYKAAYHPSELLCPLRYQWIPFDIAKPLLDSEAYVVLSDFFPPQNGETSAASIFQSMIEHLMDDDDDEDEEMVEPDFIEWLMSDENDDSDDEEMTESDSNESLMDDDDEEMNKSESDN